MAADVCYRNGSGRAIVLLHGFTQRPESFAAAVSAAPESDRPIWALALPGHHDDVPVCPTWDENIAQLAARIAAISGGSQAELPELIGYSLGARCALGLLVDQRKIASAATLIGVNPGLADPAARVARAAADATWAEILETNGIEPFVDAWENLPLWQTQSSLSQSSIDEQRRIRLGHQAKALASCLRALGLAAMPDYWGKLETIAVPVTAVSGELDQKFTDIGRRLGFRQRVVPSVGHNIVLEAPAAVWG